MLSVSGREQGGGTGGAPRQASATKLETVCLCDWLLPCSWRNYPCAGQNDTSQGTKLCWGGGGCASPLWQCQEATWLSATRGWGKQQPLPPLQKAIIKVSLAVIPIITELHQQPDYRCFQCVIPGVGSVREEEGLSAMAVIEAKKECAGCVPCWAGANGAHATLSGTVLVRDGGETGFGAAKIGLWGQELETWWLTGRAPLIPAPMWRNSPGCGWVLGFIAQHVLWPVQSWQARFWVQHPASAEWQQPGWGV